MASISLGTEKVRRLWRVMKRVTRRCWCHRCAASRDGLSQAFPMGTLQNWFLGMRKPDSVYEQTYIPYTKQTCGISVVMEFHSGAIGIKVC